MNLFKKTLLSLAIAFSAGAANADVIVDTISAANVTGAGTDITTSHSVTFKHDITDGYVVNIDQILSALLTVSLIDPNDGNETFTFTIGSGTTSQVYSNQNLNNGSQGASYPIPLTSSLADLVADGLLSVTLSASEGGYRFVSSTLTANVERPAAPSNVPEPATVALLGLGLLGVAASRRKSGKGTNA